MGFSTEFEGRFTVAPPFLPEHAAYLRAFSASRRMKRDEVATASLPDPGREAVGLPAGPEGAFYIGVSDSGVLDRNTPPKGQPELWCQWVPSADLEGIEWSGHEKFYSPAEWLDYWLQSFLLPWGYRVSGSVQWTVEEHSCAGAIEARGDHVVQTQYELEDDPASGRIVYSSEFNHRRSGSFRQWLRRTLGF